MFDLRVKGLIAHVWLAGATGLVGDALLQKLLAAPHVGTITTLVRRPTARTHPKLQEVVVDFEQLEHHLEGRSASHVFCCLGTTIAAAGSQTAFRRVDHQYPLALARAALKAGVRRFLVVTSLGANPKSRLFYNRVKGDLERDLRALAIPELHLFRPSLLLGERTQHRSGERLAMALARPAQLLLAGPLRKYRPIAAAVVAQAMLNVASDPRPAATPVTIHESHQIASRAVG